MSEEYKQVREVLEEILNKGGGILYDEYLDQKMPNQCRQNIIQNLAQKINVMVNDKPKINHLKQQSMPNSIHPELTMPNRASIRSRSQFSTNRTKLHNNSAFQKSAASNFNNCKPISPFKRYGKKNQTDISEDKMRQQKILKQEQNLKTINQQQKYESEKASHKEKLALKINNILKTGIPHAYDDEGDIFSMDSRTFRLGNHKKQQKLITPINLKIKALDVISSSNPSTQTLCVTGRTKGYATQHLSSTKKENNFFDNCNSRQTSMIPFTKVQQGVKIVEKDNNLMTQKARKPAETRDQYCKSAKNSNFTSRINLDIDSKSNTINTQRGTSRSFSRLRPCSVNGAFSVMSKANRPKTALSWQRITIYNRQQADEMIKPFI